VRSGTTPTRACAPPRPSRPEPVGACAQPFEEARYGFDQPHVAADRLDQNRRQPSADAREVAVDVVEVVVTRDREIVDDRVRNARSQSIRRLGGRAGVLQREIEMPVVVA